MKLLLASRNPGKLAELRRMLVGSGWEVLDLSAVDQSFVTDEPFATFEDNARHKARQAVGAFDMRTLADDSGLEIDALGGEPGVRSARYSGDNASDADRYQKVLGMMSAVPDEARTARFRCVVCVRGPAGDERTFEGRCEGRIAREARGSGGFGYDPIFVPEGYTRSFAELGADVKDRLSHRGRAMRLAVDYLMSVLRV